MDKKRVSFENFCLSYLNGARKFENLEIDCYDKSAENYVTLSDKLREFSLNASDDDIKKNPLVLEGCVVRGLQLKGFDFPYSVLKNTVLENCNIFFGNYKNLSVSSSQISSSNFSHCYFEGSDIKKLILERVVVTDYSNNIKLYENNMIGHEKIGALAQSLD